MGRYTKAKGEICRQKDGTYFRNIGKRADSKEPWKFRLGKDRAQADHRNLQLERLWDCIDRRANMARQQPVWDPVTIQIGQALARGEAVVRLVPPPWQEDPHWQEDPDSLCTAAPVMVETWHAEEWLRQMQMDFPVIRIELANDRIANNIKEVERTHQEIAEERAERYRKLAEDCGQVATGQTLHMALDAWAEHIRRKYPAPDGSGMLTEHGTRVIACIGRLKEHWLKEHKQDRPLDQLGNTELYAWEDYWANRPMGSPRKKKPAQRMATDTVKYAIKRIREFVRWLDESSAWKWNTPRGYRVRPITIRLTHEEKAARRTGARVKTYTLDELGILYEYATPWERLLMLLGINCGFGEAEIATLLVEELYLDDPHGPRIKRFRYKTDVEGEWELWPATVQAIRWQLARRGQTEQKALVLTKTGRPLSKPTAGNNRNGRIPAAWASLHKRICKDHEDFRFLSFGKLRKTAANLVKQKSDAETADVFLSHGEPGLQRVYTEVHYAKVFAAQAKVLVDLQPMFAKVPDPFPAADKPQRKPALSLGKIKRIQALRAQGFKLKVIAETCDVTVDTVRRYCKPQ